MTTLRDRRTDWLAAGVFDKLVEEALAGYDRNIGLDLSEVAIDGSLHKVPCGGEGTGPNPTDRAKSGWKWSVATELIGEWRKRGVADQQDFAMLGEAATTEIARNKDAQGFLKNKRAAREGGSVAGDARRQLEAKSGRKVITSENYLNDKPKPKLPNKLKNPKKS